LNKTELADYYAAADVFALTSHYDNFPNAVIEALASGLPVVAAKVGGIDMQIESGKTGFLIAKNQPVLFQKALHKLLSQDKFRQTMSLACRQRVCQKFNWQQTAAQFIALVNKSISTKKITLHLISGLGMGGAEQMLYKIIANSRYPASQHSVISLTDRGVFAEKLRNLGCQVIVLGMRQNPIAVLSSMIKIIKKLYQLCPDTLIGWMYHGCFSASIARLFYYRKVKLIWNIRHTPGDLKTERRTTRWLIYALKVLLWLPQKIIYNAFASAEYHEQRLGYVKHKRQIIPNGFDLQHFQASQTLRHDFRQQYNIDEQTLLIGHVARFHPMKGHSILLQAFQKILVWQPDAVLVMCGRLVSSANAQLKTKLSQLGLENQVILLAEYSDLASLYPALDLLVQSSLWGEGFPNVLGEAMACEVPCVVTNVGDSGRIVDQAGYVVAPADPGALAKACIRLLSQSKESRVQLGGVGREKIAQHYTIAKVSQQFDAL
ncbi:MAG: glycosyltransferase, partial [Gammaproteobacteria bacterium]|nr:glycosyltransferase [Gammaproteobacteria bacterium]